jgi:hypothetical protein
LSSKESFCGALLSHVGTLATLAPLNKAPSSISEVYVFIAGPVWSTNMTRRVEELPSSIQNVYIFIKFKIVAKVKWI